MTGPPNLPASPVYVISKGRADCCYTAQFLQRDGVPFRLVVEPQEAVVYEAAGFGQHIERLPFSNLGLGGIPARNWCWEHARASGASHHWILDDNIRAIRQSRSGNRYVCKAGPALAASEAFFRGYANVPLAGLNYQMFVTPGAAPFAVNVHVYSCLWIQNDLPFRWRGRYNEDTDLCLQTLASGHCTILLNSFMIEKMRTMTMKGGNTDSLYQGDGRLRMARSLERLWPRIVTTQRRFGRPQHVVRWEVFDTPLVPRAPALP